MMLYKIVILLLVIFYEIRNIISNINISIIISNTLSNKMDYLRLNYIKLILNYIIYY